MEKIAYSVPEAAERLSISRSKLYELIKQGVGPDVTRFQGRSVILHEELLRWARKSSQGKEAA